jgi:hypothetical protein
MHHQHRTQTGDALLTFAEGSVVARRELINATVTQDGIETEHASLNHLIKAMVSHSVHPGSLK